LIYHEITYDAVVKKTPPTRLPLWKVRGQLPAFWRPCLPLSTVTVSLHYLPRSLRSTITCGKTHEYRDLKWIVEDLLPWYCYTIKTNSRTIPSQVWQPASTGKGTDMSELQAYYRMTPELW